MSERLGGCADPGALDADALALYRELVHGRRAERPPAFPLTGPSGRLNGPAATWLLHPPLGTALERLGATVSYDLTLSARCKETVILTVAHHHDSVFEKYAHRLGAARAGFTAEETEELCAGRTPASAGPEERCTHRVARTLLADGRLDDASHAEALAVLGPKGLFEAVTLTGFYTLLAYQLGAYAIVPPAGG
ncbi:carboxymuconolactone decarboxylase family protein [Streptomyces tagetis]|uniref:Carboxymuconolactone decarboxylase family protein n=1 Tax=Streptomyces tagetis TaxID=2820809 RepID=A0A940XKW4_9ACTN|nr:carboxymuconolactone decarboxylase family protein [Streptomyces sp. RG38]MBQ0826535.1 carboxymuconolactone decarboxylase family protein [Streptomyces sp. RG38]